MRVLVTDGSQRAALAVVRSLGAAGHEVHVADRRRASLAGASRFAAASHVLPDPLDAPAAAADALAALVGRTGSEVVIPITEGSMLVALGSRARLGGAVVPFGSLESFRAVCDKRRVAAEAARVGIAVPEQYVLETPDCLPALEVEPQRYPLVVKPTRSVADTATGREKLGVRYARDRRELEAVVAGLPAGAFPLLLQQRIVGPGVGVFLLLWDGVRATFCHQRLREKPPSGGVSVYREAVALDADLVARSAELLRRLEWRGVAMVEFKRDAATGTPFIMEINGRFWGSLQLAIDAGVDFPAMLVDCVGGAVPAVPAPYTVGVRSRWWWGDVDHLLTVLRRSREELLLPPGEERPRGRAIADFLHRGPMDRDEVLRWSDPRPFLHESVRWLLGG